MLFFIAARTRFKRNCFKCEISNGLRFDTMQVKYAESPLYVSYSTELL